MPPARKSRRSARFVPYPVSVQLPELTSVSELPQVEASFGLSPTVEFTDAPPVKAVAPQEVPVVATRQGVRLPNFRSRLSTQLRQTRKGIKDKLRECERALRSLCPKKSKKKAKKRVKKPKKPRKNAKKKL